jgi:Holliday junction resolvase-like predicted endonuclease
MWSLRQQAVVAEFTGYITFVDFKTGKVVNLLEAGEPYATLHAQIQAKIEKAAKLSAEWRKKNPPKVGEPRL